MELQEEMSSADVVLLLSSVPERTSDLVYWLDEARLRYRHGPAFPTLGGLNDEELDRPLQETLEDFARVRRRTVDLLHGWGKSEWDRTITDPRGGEMTLLEVCRLVARHEMGHIGQIRNLSALLPEPQDLGPVRPAGANGK